MAEDITMADFQKACHERLEYAVANNEPGLDVITFTNPEGGELIVRTEFTTPAGLSLVRYGGGFMRVECDFSDLDSETTEQTRVEFYEDGTQAPQVVEIVSGNKGHTERTIKRANHDHVAAELSKFLTLIP